MIRATTPELVGTWQALLQDRDGIDETEAGLIAAQLAGDFRLDTRKLSSPEEIPEIIDIVEEVIIEFQLEGALSNADAEPVVREELLSSLEQHLSNRVGEETDPAADDRWPGTNPESSPPRAHGLGAVRDPGDDASTDDPSNAVELYNYLRELEMDSEDIEAVLEDLKADREDG